MPESLLKPDRCVARQDELGRLGDHLDAALRGERSICCVTGEAGAGKSRLLAEFCHIARRRYPDIVIADGICNAQTGQGDPFLPFREILTELTGDVADGSRSPGSPDADSPRAQRWFALAKRALFEHGPDLVDIFVPGGALVTRLGAQAALGTRMGKRMQRPSPSDIAASGIEQSHICEQYTNFLRRLASERPLLLIVDDLHWADNASVDLLFHLSRRLVELPCLIVGAYRPEALAPDPRARRHALATALNEIRRYQGETDIALSADEGMAMTFIHALLDAEPNELDDAFRHALFRHTRGNALFTVELLRDMQENGKLIQDDSGRWIATSALSWNELPARIEGVIHERVARLSGEEHNALTLAAVMGLGFDAETLATAMGSSVRDVVTLVSGVPAKQLKLVRPLGVRRVAGVRLSAYEFAHSLFQSFFYNTLDDIERIHAHEQIGLAIEELLGPGSDMVAVQLARHFALAEREGQAIKYLVTAARQSYRSHAVDEALVHATHALQMLDGSPCLPGDRDNEVRLELHPLLGHLQVTRCDYESAREHFEAALRMSNNEPVVMQAQLRRFISQTWERENEREKAASELETALAMLGSPDDERPEEWWREWLSNRLARIKLAYWAGDSALMSELVDEVGPLIESHGNDSQRSQLWTSIAMLGYRRERFLLSAETVAAADAALAASRSTDSLVEQVDTMFGAGFARVFRRDDEVAAQLLSEALALAEKCGDLQAEARILTYLSVVYRQSGESTALANVIARTLEAARTASATDYVAVAIANRAWLAWKAGNMADAERDAREAIGLWEADAPRYPLQWLARLLLIDLELRGGEVRQAIEHADQLLREPMAALGGGVSDGLHEAVRQHGAGELQETRACLERTLAAAENYGYL